MGPVSWSAKTGRSGLPCGRVASECSHHVRLQTLLLTSGLYCLGSTLDQSIIPPPLSYLLAGPRVPPSFPSFHVVLQLTGDHFVGNFLGAGRDPPCSDGGTGTQAHGGTFTVGGKRDWLLLQQHQRGSRRLCQTTLRFLSLPLSPYLLKALSRIYTKFLSCSCFLIKEQCCVLWLLILSKLWLPHTSSSSPFLPSLLLPDCLPG